MQDSDEQVAESNARKILNMGNGNNINEKYVAIFIVESILGIPWEEFSYVTSSNK